MTLKEIDEEIKRLKRLRDVERDKEIAELQKTAEKNVGRCFEVNGIYVKVVGVPQDKYQFAGDNFNPYQYPAIYLDYDDVKTLPNCIPFYSETLYSGAWGEGGNPSFERKCREISREEFNEEFEKRIREFREKITGEPKGDIK